MKLFLDASALVAIIAGESDADILARRMANFTSFLTSPIARWEAVIALFRSHNFDWLSAQKNVDDLLALHDVAIVPIGELEGQYALGAYARYGRGQHPAKLNMGDCFAYACTRIYDATLLYKGDDFARTDLG